LDDFVGAIKDFTGAIEINPKFTEAYSNRAAAKGNLKDFAGAIQDYTLAIEINPDLAQAYAERGVAKYFYGDKTGACFDWRKAAALGFAKANELLKQHCK